MVEEDDEDMVEDVGEDLDADFNHDDHAYADKDIGKEVHDLNEKLKQQEREFQLEREKFEEEKRKQKIESLNMQRSLRKAERKLKDLKDTTTKNGAAHMEEMVRLRLKDHFSKATLDLILDKNRSFSKKWTNKDFCFAMLMKMVSPKALKLLRKTGLLPTPANSTIKRKFSFLHVTPGKIFQCKQMRANYVTY